MHNLLLNAPAEWKEGTDHTVSCFVAGAAPPLAVIEGMEKEVHITESDCANAADRFMNNSPFHGHRGSGQCRDPVKYLVSETFLPGNLYQERQ